MDRLQDIPADAADTADEAFERATGELLIDEPGAPDRDDYDDVEDGYRQYLHDCHEWAVGEYVRELGDLKGDAETLRQAARDYPDLGHFDTEASNAREVEETVAKNVAEAFHDVVAARSRIKRIEGELDR